MPRPKRNIEITVGEAELREALQLWLKRYHQLDINARSVEFDFDESNILRGVKFQQTPKHKGSLEQKELWLLIRQYNDIVTRNGSNCKEAMLFRAEHDHPDFLAKADTIDQIKQATANTA